MDNEARENFFGRIRVERINDEKLKVLTLSLRNWKDIIDYYNKRISIKLKGMSSVQYRTHSKAS